MTIHGLYGAQTPDTTDGVRVNALTFGSPFSNLIETMTAESNTSKIYNATAAGIIEGVYLGLTKS